VFVMEKNNVQINIQSLRFLAAHSVVIYHAVPHYIAAGGSDNVLLQWIGLTAYAGVDVFFVISGYIIWVSTSHVSGLKDAGNFLCRRAIRIYSGYWPYLLILSVLFFAYGVTYARQIDVMGSIFLTQPKHEKLLLPVAWSLAYELYFYACFFLLLMFPKSIGRKILYVSLLLSLITMFMLWFIDLAVMRQNFHWALKASRFFLSPYIAEFIAGCLLAIYYEKGGKVNLLLCSIICFLALVSAVLYQLNSGMGAESFLNYPHVRVAFWAPVAILLVVIFSEAERRGKVFFKQSALLLGGASYSLYLAHTIIFDALYLSGLRSAIGDYFHVPLLFIVLAVLLVLVYSVWHYRYIETPLMMISKRMLRRLA
jgi:exopolysaccharide production protein ExoZ